jgi:hypothetical protein
MTAVLYSSDEEIEDPSTSVLNTAKSPSVNRGVSSKSARSTVVRVVSTNGGKSLTAYIPQEVFLFEDPEREGEFTVCTDRNRPGDNTPYECTRVRDSKLTDSSGSAVYTVVREGNERTNPTPTQELNVVTAQQGTFFELKKLLVDCGSRTLHPRMTPSVFIYECREDRVEWVRGVMNQVNAKIVEGDPDSPVSQDQAQ